MHQILVYGRSGCYLIFTVTKQLSPFAPASWATLRVSLQQRWPKIQWPEAPVDGLEALEPVEQRFMEDFCLSRLAVVNEGARQMVLTLIDSCLKRWAKRQSFPEHLIADAAQQTAMSLLGSPPRIVEYAARAPLESWIQVVAVRSALSLVRAKSQQADVPLDDLPWAEWKDDVTTPEERAHRRQARTQFSVVFRKVVKALPDRDRAILSLRFTRGVEVDPLARMYNVHRVTMARWLSDARERLVDELTRQLPDGVGIEVSQLREWLGTNPELSMERLFQLTRESSLHLP